MTFITTHTPKHVVNWTVSILLMSFITIKFNLFDVYVGNFDGTRLDVKSEKRHGRSSTQKISWDKTANMLAMLQEPLETGQTTNNFLFHDKPERTKSKADSHAGTIVFDSLPGAFAQNSLYFQSIRLTTSYEAAVDDLHVDLFAFPSDLARVESKFLACKNVSDSLNKTLLGRDELKENVTLFCQVDAATNQRNLTPQHSKNLIKMLYVPTLSLDVNQNLASSLLWRCNVTETLNKPQLLRYIDNDGVPGDKTTAFVPVHIWMQYRHSGVAKIATFQIPLETGAVGVGSVHIQGGKAKSYFHQPPVVTGLCVAIHGTKPLTYLSQFVQHHLNVGFHSIVIGMHGPPDSNELKQARRLLARYIDQGLVALAHYRGMFGAPIGPAKLQFYSSCLYHYKGIAKYVATWDIDEFWLPPETLDMNGRHNHGHYKLGARIIQPGPELANKSSLMMNKSLRATFPLVVQNDPLWQHSRYAQSVSIADTLNAIDNYFSEHGCASSFCYHAFPSRVVFVRDGKNRTKRISRDFPERQGGYTAQWLKSVVHTKHAHSVGFHYGGSCTVERYVNANLPWASLVKQFHALSPDGTCYPRLFDHDVYGSMHHFFELLTTRGIVPFLTDNETQVDEYAAYFGPTVERQLERDDPQTFTTERQDPRNM